MSDDTDLIAELRMYPATEGRGDPLEVGFVSRLMTRAADALAAAQAELKHRQDIIENWREAESPATRDKREAAAYIAGKADALAEIERLRMDNAAVHAANAGLSILVNRARAAVLEEAAKVVGQHIAAIAAAKSGLANDGASFAANRILIAIRALGESK